MAGSDDVSTTTNEFRDLIEKIRAEYEKVSLLGRLTDNLIGQFVDDYSDKFPFILELIQNAVDSAPSETRVKIRFALRQESDCWTLDVANNGTPFDLADIERLCGANRHRKGSGKIGYKGLGFKTVTLVTDNPRVYSRSCQFEFNKALHPEHDQLWIVIPHWIESTSIPDTVPAQDDWVSFSLPLRHDVSLDELSSELDGLTSGRAVALLLFLQDLDELVIDNAYSGRCFAVRKQIDPANPLVCHLLRSNCATSTAVAEDLLGSWIVTNFPSEWKLGKQLDVTPEALNEFRSKRGSEPNHTAESLGTRPLISLAFRTLTDETGVRFQKNEKGSVCAFFPVHSEGGSGLYFAVQADFLTTQNRERLLPNSAWNTWIFDNLPLAIASAVQEFKNASDWNQFIYESMPLEDEGEGAFRDVTQKLCELLRKAQIILTDAPETNRWVRPEEAVWIEDGALRELITGSEHSLLPNGKILVSGRVRSDDSNRGRAGIFLRLPKGMGVEEIKRDHILQLLQRQHSLDSLSEDLDWFQKLFLFLSDGKGVTDRVIEQLRNTRFIPTADSGVLAGIGDVFIEVGGPSAYPKEFVVNHQISGHPKIRQLLVSRFRIPEGATMFVSAVVANRNQDVKDADVLWRDVRFLKTYYDVGGGSPDLEPSIRERLRQRMRLKAHNGRWLLIRELCLPPQEHYPSDPHPDTFVSVPEGPDSESWLAFFEWLGVPKTPIAPPVVKEIDSPDSVRPPAVDQVAPEKSKQELREDAGAVDAPGPGEKDSMRAETAKTGASEGVTVIEDRSGVTQRKGAIGERVAFAYIRDRLFESLKEHSPLLEVSDDDHFRLVSQGTILAEGFWGNGGSGDDGVHSEWGEHFDFWVSIRGQKHYYEVKATAESADLTSRKGGDQFHLTRAESELALEMGNRYHVVRVYGIGDGSVSTGPESDLVVIDDPASKLNSGTLMMVVKGSLAGEYTIAVRRVGLRQ